MKMKPFLLLFVILAITSLACSMGGSAPEAASTETPGTSSQDQPVVPETEATQQLENTPELQISGDGAQVREVSGFTGVGLYAPGTLYIEQGDQESLRIEAEPDLLGRINAFVNDENILMLIPDTMDNFPTNVEIEYFVVVRELQQINLVSSGNLEAEPLEVGTLLLLIDGSGILQFEEIQGETLDVRNSASGNIEVLGGAVDFQDIRLNGSGGYQAAELASQRAEVRLNGSGGARVRVAEDLKVWINGSGGVEYIGNPAMEVRSNGSGEVLPIGE